MTYYGPQFMYFTNAYGQPSELVNGARLAENMASASRFSNVLESGGCWALNFEPCTMDSTGATEAWQPAVFSEEGAPWFNGTDASRDAIGFYIEEWTGLDGAHHTRSVTPLGINRGGALFGPQSHNHRVMKVNLLIHGRNAEACNYLFRWLEQQLLNACNPCSSQQIWLREFDPGFNFDNIERGLARANRVALIEGPTWEADPVPSGTCHIRRTSFTLAAGDPCLYRPTQDGAEATVLASGAPLSTVASVTGPTYWTGSAMRVSAEVAPGDYGNVAAKVTFSSTVATAASGRKSLPDYRIAAFAHPSNAPSASLSQLPKIGELVISGVGTSGLEIEVNMAERQVRYRDIGSNSAWRNGSGMIGAVVGGLRRWWTLDACFPGIIVVEPVYPGLLNSRTGLADPPTSWGVTLETITRFGCS